MGALGAMPTVTSTGMVVGSPGFMSPEQAEGREVGPPSDVFSLGAVLAFAATGEGPFGTGSSAALIYRLVHNPPDLNQAPIETRPLIERCLAKDPEGRPSPRDILAERAVLRCCVDSTSPWQLFQRRGAVGCERPVAVYLERS